MSNVLEVTDLFAGYGGELVLKGVELRVAPGELWVVLGPNGAGKSTLLRAVLGLVRPQKGAVSLWGRPQASWKPAELARRLAWVPQSFEPAFGFTAGELVTMGRSPHLGLWGLTSKEDEATGHQVMEELGVGALWSRRVTELSGGEARLCLLARALVQRPELLLLDEPTAFLDLRHQVDALVRVRERTRAGMAAVAVLHDVNLAAAFADRVLLLRAGEVVGQDRPTEALTPAHLERLFGIPMAAATTERGQALFAPRIG